MDLLKPFALALLASTALAPGAAAASGQTAKPSPSLQAQLQQAQAQMARMQAQIDALEKRLTALTAPNAADAAQVAQTQTQAQPTPGGGAPETPTLASTAETARHADATAAQALASAEKAQGAIALTQRAVAATKWAANTSISGEMFLNLSNITQHTAGANNAANGVGVNLKRAFIGVNHRFTSKVSAAILLDADNVTGQPTAVNPPNSSANLVGKGIYVRNAYAEVKLHPALTIRLGAAEMPWISYAEAAENQRHVERSLLERIGYGNPADWGVHLSGDFLRQGTTSLSYGLAVVNGGGYRQARVTKSVDVEARLSGTWNGFYAAAGGYYGKRGNDIETLAGNGASSFRTASRIDFMGGYKSSVIGIGGEYFYARDWNNVAVNPAVNALSQDTASGWSAFGHYNLSRQWRAFLRYDQVHPNRMTVRDLQDDLFIGGLQFSPLKYVDLALVYKRETVNGGSLATSNGVIGCGGTATPNFFATVAGPSALCKGNGTYDEVGLFTAIRF
ncbi:hypothetical protein [Novosphingobium sp. KACC 22771]|uniref:hypothetical protein n=1 Tax=Novosphingobium sp. KACC 22771 TaxID=3025670 RepID=UPI002365676A|nr:hypothetical protein [Novosphingobium sp. KACC 22771]WDF73533.1 hypothetical protein PQ467_05680 [Novosphingobium sp. KACC 22771]